MSIFKKYIKYLVLIFIIAFIFFGPFKQYINVDYLVDFFKSIKENPFAPLIFIGIYILCVVLAIPGSAITILAGVVFSFWKAALLVTIAANIGCTITFFLTKFFAKDLVEKLLRKNEKTAEFLNVATEKILKNGFLFMFYIRILPIFPFSLVNYSIGLTSMKYRDYAIASFIGMLPGTLVYIYLSNSASNVTKNPIGLVISILVAIVFTIVLNLLKNKFQKNKSQ